MRVPVWRRGKTSTCSVSCDTSDLRQMLKEDQKVGITIATDARERASDKNIKSCEKKPQECPFGSKLSSIREEMREFCNSMDRFVDENKIVFKNGEVQEFWSGKKMVDANLQTDSVDVDDENREVKPKVVADEEDKLDSTERKVKIRETRNEEREVETRVNTIETKDNETTKNSDDRSSKKDELAADNTNNFQSVYDLMTLKTFPNTLPDTTETYPMKDTNGYQYEPSAKPREKAGTYSSFLTELRCQNKMPKNCESNVSKELISLERKLDPETSMTDDTAEKSLFNVTRNLESEKECSKCKNIAETSDKCVKIEILEDKFNDVSLESPQEKKNTDESDDDSFKTATSLQEDSQVPGNNQESREVRQLQNNCDKLIDAKQRENVVDLTDTCRKEIISNDGDDDAIRKDEDTNDEVEDSPNKTTGNSEQEFPMKELDSEVKSFVQAMDRLSVERTNQPSRLMGKRTREAEDVEISNKKSFLIEEFHSGRNSEERKPRSQVSEKCRQHLIQETRRFAKKVSPLIDKCITSLIKDTESIKEKSRYQKYDRRSLGEYLPYDYASRMSLGKPKGDFGEQIERRDKRIVDKSNDLTKVYSEKQEFTQEQTVKSESDKPGTIV